MPRELTPSELERIEAKDTRIAQLESQRVSAMNSRDAKNYSRLCSVLGVTPELPELIDQAEAERILQSRGQYGIEQEYELNTLAHALHDGYGRQTNSSRIEWLKSQGYSGVKVSGVEGKTVKLENAPEKNVYSLYMRHREKLEAQLRQIKDVLRG